MAQSSSAADNSRAGGSGGGGSPGSTLPASSGSSQAASMATPTSQGGSRSGGSRGSRGRRRGPPSRRAIRGSKYFRLVRIKRLLRLHSRARRISPTAAMACAITIEIVLEEIVQLSKRVAALARKGKISNRHVHLAIQSTDWLRELFDRSIIPEAGVAPNLQQPPTPPPKSKHSKGQVKKEQHKQRPALLVKAVPKLPSKSAALNGPQDASSSASSSSGSD